MRFCEVVDHTYLPNEVLSAPFPGERCHLCGRAATIYMPCIDHCGHAGLGNDADYFCDECAGSHER